MLGTEDLTQHINFIHGRRGLSFMTAAVEADSQLTSLAGEAYHQSQQPQRLLRILFMADEAYS